MPVNQVYKATGEKIIDISDSTVTAEALKEGFTAYNAAGEKITGAIPLSSWKQLQNKVRNNDMSDILISDQYACNKDKAILIFDVIGKRQDTPTSSLYTNTLTLRTHYQLPDAMQFDAPEAFYYCESGLAAGTYYMKLSYYYQFTLTQPVPVGGQLCFGGSTSYVDSYSSALSRTKIERVYCSQISSGSQVSGTNLGIILQNNKNGNFNTWGRATDGNSNWKESAIRQWLNSNKPAGEWWQPQNNWDRPPDYADTVNGFLYDLDSDFLEVVGFTSKITARNTADGGGTDTTEDLFFLLSQTEVYGGQAITGIDEGQAYTFYSDNSSLSAPGTGNDTNRITYRNGSAAYYCLRTPTSGTPQMLKSVRFKGEISNVFADNGSTTKYGIVLACNII